MNPQLAELYKNVKSHNLCHQHQNVLLLGSASNVSEWLHINSGILGHKSDNNFGTTIIVSNYGEYVSCFYPIYPLSLNTHNQTNGHIEIYKKMNEQQEQSYRFDCIIYCATDLEDDTNYYHHRFTKKVWPNVAVFIIFKSDNYSKIYRFNKDSVPVEVCDDQSSSSE